MDIKLCTTYEDAKAYGIIGQEESRKIKELLEEYKVRAKIADEADKEFQPRLADAYKEKHKIVAERVHEIEDCLMECAKVLQKCEMRATAKFGPGVFSDITVNIDFIAEYVTDNGDPYIDYDDYRIKTSFMRDNVKVQGDIDDREDRFTRMLVERWNADGVEKKLYDSIKQQIAAEIQVKKNIPPFWKAELEAMQNS